jgi:PAS domain-containing protein/anti-sigma regulatory factor (Ser/Thr protein kinase)
MGRAATSAAWDVVATADAVPGVRALVRRQLQEWGREAVVDDVELVVTELLANVVLHAPGAARVSLAVDGDGLLLEVSDSGAAMPAPRLATDSGTTGRGLGLVTGLTEAWGWSPDPEGTGKTVWCRFGSAPRDVEPDLDVDALLASFDDDAEVGHEVVVGWAPTALVAAAKDHLDGLLRELALAEGSVGGSLPQDVVEHITSSVARFAEPRAQLRRLLTRAQAAGERRLQIRFTLPAELADAGEDYLLALAEMDAHARDRRLLSLESPAAFRVLREWYVRSLVEGLRRSAGGEAPAEAESFEERLLEELQGLDERARRAELAAQLQQVTAWLAAADSLEDIARIAVKEGMSALGASGGALTRPVDGRAVSLLEAGADQGIGRLYEQLPGRPTGPSTEAIRTGLPVFVSGREERDARFPVLGRTQPGAGAVAAVPLTVVGEAVGALRFSWQHARLLVEAERSYLQGLAAQTAQAVARADALQQLRDAEWRSGLLARLGERLAGDQTPTALAEAVLDAVVPLVGDWALLHLVAPTGRIEMAGGRHRDPELAVSLNALFERFEVTLDQPYGAGYAIATGTTQELPAISEELLRAVAPGDDDFVAQVLDTGVRTGVIVPLVAQGNVLGALSIGRTDAQVPPDVVAVAEDVGRRAGSALHGSRALATSVSLELALTAASVGSFQMHVPTGALHWDDRLFAMLDIDPDAFDGTLASFFARVLPEDAQRTAAAIEAAVESVGELDVEYRVLLRDGSVRWLQGRGRALAGPDGTAEWLVGVAVDVTAQRDQSALARRTLELMADGFFQVDREWRFLYVNSQAEAMLRRSRHELLGEVLWEAFPEAVGSGFESAYRAAVEAGEAVRFESRFDPLGTTFEVRAFPDHEGLAVYFTDVGERRAAERERDRALERLRLLNDVGAALTATLDLDEALTRLATRLVPVLGDLVTVDVTDEVLQRARGVVVATDEARAEAVRRADARVPRRDNPATAVHRVLSGEPVVQVVSSPAYLERVSVDEAQLADFRLVDLRHLLVVPLVARGRVVGALSLSRTGDGAVAHTDDEVQLALDIGRRAGLLVDNAAQFDAQRTVAEGLQRSLLPELPATIDGLRLGAAYEPSSSAAKVGGDWYDAFPLPDGGVGLVIGDVMGHDIAAAAAMGQLRSVLRTLAAEGDDPARVLDRLDRLVAGFAMADLATVVYARLDREPDGGARLTWCNAGHPPPLLLEPGRPARYLEGAVSTMVGVEVGQPRTSSVELLPPGASMLLYTDGLVERRDADLDSRLELVRSRAESLDAGSPAELCRRLLAAVRRGGSSDDVALLALTLD